jgi:hypothetical protein
MREGGQHPGRIILGTVVSPPTVIASAQFLLQDERGFVVVVYNMLPAGLGLADGARCIAAVDGRGAHPDSFIQVMSSSLFFASYHH